MNTWLVKDGSNPAQLPHAKDTRTPSFLLFFLFSSEVVFERSPDRRQYVKGNDLPTGFVFESCGSCTGKCGRHFHNCPQETKYSVGHSECGWSALCFIGIKLYDQNPVRVCKWRQAASKPTRQRPDVNVRHKRTTCVRDGPFFCCLTSWKST